VAALRQLPDPRAAAGLAALLGAGVVSDPELSDALVAIGPQAATALAPLLETSPSTVRLAAIEALGALASAHPAALPDEADLVATLDRAADDAELAVRRAALVALAEFGPSGRAHLTTRLDDPAVAGLARGLLALPAD
jgi:HEAT repeat protein